MSLSILIIGGTRFIGPHVVQALRGHQVTVFHRGQTGADMPGVQHLFGERAKLSQHSSAIRRLEPDVVIDMIPQNGSDARGLVTALDGLRPRVVAISSASVYRTFGVMLGTEMAEVDNRPRSEDAPLRTRLYPYRGKHPRAADDPHRFLDDYDKIAAEQCFLQAPFDCSIVRLPLVYGPGDPDQRGLGYLRRMREGAPRLRIRESVAQWRNSRACVENVAAGIACVAMGGKPGRVYNLSEPDDFPEVEWVRFLADELGWGGKLEIVPDDAANGGPDIDDLPANTNYAQHLRLDSSRIRKELGYEEPVSCPEARRRLVSSFVAVGKAAAGQGS